MPSAQPKPTTETPRARASAPTDNDGVTPALAPTESVPTSVLSPDDSWSLATNSHVLPSDLPPMPTLEEQAAAAESVLPPSDAGLLSPTRWLNSTNPYASSHDIERRHYSRFGRICASMAEARIPVPKGDAYPTDKQGITGRKSTYELSHLRTACQRRGKLPPGEEAINERASSTPMERYQAREAIHQKRQRAATAMLSSDGIPTTAAEYVQRPSEVEDGPDVENEGYTYNTMFEEDGQKRRRILTAAEQNAKQAHASWLTLHNLARSHDETVWDCDRTLRTMIVTGGRMYGPKEKPLTSKRKKAKAVMMRNKPRKKKGGAKDTDDNPESAANGKDADEGEDEDEEEENLGHGVSTRIHGWARWRDHVSTVQRVPIDVVSLPVETQTVAEAVEMMQRTIATDKPSTDADDAKYRLDTRRVQAAINALNMIYQRLIREGLKEEALEEQMAAQGQVIMVGRPSLPRWFLDQMRTSHEARMKGLKPKYVLANQNTTNLTVQQIQRRMRCVYGAFFRPCVREKGCLAYVYMQKRMDEGWRPVGMRADKGMPEVHPFIEDMSEACFDRIAKATETGVKTWRKYRSEKASHCIVCTLHVDLESMQNRMIGTPDAEKNISLDEQMNRAVVLKKMEELQKRARNGNYDPYSIFVEEADDAGPVSGSGDGSGSDAAGPTRNTDPYHGIPDVFRPSKPISTTGVVLRPCVPDRTSNVYCVDANREIGTFNREHVIPAAFSMEYGILGNLPNVNADSFVPKLFSEKVWDKALQRPVDTDVLGFVFHNKMVFDQATASIPPTADPITPSEPSILVGTEFTLPTGDGRVVAVFVHIRHCMPPALLVFLCRPPWEIANNIRDELATLAENDPEGRGDDTPLPVGFLPILRKCKAGEKPDSGANSKGFRIFSTYEQDKRPGGTAAPAGATNPDTSQPAPPVPPSFSGMGHATVSTKIDSTGKPVRAHRTRRREKLDPRSSTYEADLAAREKAKWEDGNDFELDSCSYEYSYSEDEKEKEKEKEGDTTVDPAATAVAADDDLSFPAYLHTPAQAGPATSATQSRSDTTNNPTVMDEVDGLTSKGEKFYLSFFFNRIVTGVLVNLSTIKWWMESRTQVLLQFLLTLDTVGKIRNHLIVHAIVVKAFFYEGLVRRMMKRNRSVTDDTRETLYKIMRNNFEKVALVIERMNLGLRIDDVYISASLDAAAQGLTDGNEFAQLTYNPPIHTPRIALHIMHQKNTVSYAMDVAGLTARAVDKLGLLHMCPPEAAKLLTAEDFTRLVDLAMQNKSTRDIAEAAALAYRRWDPREVARLVGITAAAATVTSIGAQATAVVANMQGNAVTAEELLRQSENTIPEIMWRWSKLSSVARVVVLLLIARINLAAEAMARLSATGLCGMARILDPLGANVTASSSSASVPELFGITQPETDAVCRFMHAHVQLALRLISAVVEFHKNEIAIQRNTSRTETPEETAARYAELQVNAGLNRAPLPDDPFYPCLHRVAVRGDIPDMVCALHAAGVAHWGMRCYHSTRRNRSGTNSASVSAMSMSAAGGGGAGGGNGGGSGTATKELAHQREAGNALHGVWKSCRGKTARRRQNDMQRIFHGGLAKTGKGAVSASVSAATDDPSKKKRPAKGSAGSHVYWGDEGTGSSIRFNYTSWEEWGGKRILSIVRLFQGLMVRTGPRYDSQTNDLVKLVQEIAANTADEPASAFVRTSLMAGLCGLYEWSHTWPSFTRLLTICSSIQSLSTGVPKIPGFVTTYPFIAIVCLRMSLIYTLSRCRPMVHALIHGGEVYAMHEFAVVAVTAGRVVLDRIARGDRFEDIDNMLRMRMVMGVQEHNSLPLEPAYMPTVYQLYHTCIPQTCDLAPPGVPHLGATEDECVRHIRNIVHGRRSTSHGKKATAAAAAASSASSGKANGLGVRIPPPTPTSSSPNNSKNRKEDMRYYAGSNELLMAQILISRTTPGLLPDSLLLAHLVFLGGGRWRPNARAGAPWDHVYRNPLKLQQDVARVREVYDTIVRAARRMVSIEDAVDAWLGLRENRLYRMLDGFLYVFLKHAISIPIAICDCGIVAEQRMAIKDRRRVIVRRGARGGHDPCITATTCVPADTYGELAAPANEAHTVRGCCNVVSSTLNSTKTVKPSMTAHGTRDVGFDMGRAQAICMWFAKYTKRAAAQRNSFVDSIPLLRRRFSSRPPTIYCGDTRVSGKPTIGYALKEPPAVRCFREDALGGVVVVITTCCAQPNCTEKETFTHGGIECAMHVLPVWRKNPAKQGSGGGQQVQKMCTGRREASTNAFSVAGLLQTNFTIMQDFPERKCERCKAWAPFVMRFLTCAMIDDGVMGDEATFKFVPGSLCATHAQSLKGVLFANEPNMMLDAFLRRTLSRGWIETLRDARMAFYKNAMVEMEAQAQKAKWPGHYGKRKSGYALGNSGASAADRTAAWTKDK